MINIAETLGGFFKRKREGPTKSGESKRKEEEPALPVAQWVDIDNSYTWSRLNTGEEMTAEEQMRLMAKGMDGSDPSRYKDMLDNPNCLRGGEKIRLPKGFCYRFNVYQKTLYYEIMHEATYVVSVDYDSYNLNLDNPQDKDVHSSPYIRSTELRDGSHRPRSSDLLPFNISLPKYLVSAEDNGKPFNYRDLVIETKE